MAAFAAAAEASPACAMGGAAGSRDGWARASWRTFGHSAHRTAHRTAAPHSGRRGTMNEKWRKQRKQKRGRENAKIRDERCINECVVNEFSNILMCLPSRFLDPCFAAVSLSELAHKFLLSVLFGLFVCQRRTRVGSVGRVRCEYVGCAGVRGGGAPGSGPARRWRRHAEQAQCHPHRAADDGP